MSKRVREAPGGSFGQKNLKMFRQFLVIRLCIYSCRNIWQLILTNGYLQDQIPTISPVEVVGVIRGSEKPSIFVPANEPSSSQWFYVDVTAIARTCGLPENTIYIEYINEDVNPSKPYTIPKDVNTLIRSSVMPQDHLNYTLTWYVCRIL